MPHGIAAFRRQTCRWATGTGMSKTILTVDDSVSVRQMVSFTLKGAGYGVIEACDGRDALGKISSEVRLVITDLNMPNLDGIGLVKGLRASGVEIRAHHRAHHGIAGFEETGSEGGGRH